jgi:site-specific DNA-methyltransferase (cytosine-N4-specific)
MAKPTLNSKSGKSGKNGTHIPRSPVLNAETDITSGPVRMLLTDSLSGLKKIESESVQVCATSPPFYLLRSYGTTAISWPDGWVGELGHESHPNEFVRHLLFIFDEVWRVLKNDGCMWVNLADTFNNKQGKKGTTNAPDGSGGRFDRGGRRYADSLRAQPTFYKHFIPGVPHKSELGVPSRFLLAMTDNSFRRFVGAGEGPQWICRRTVIWSKSLTNIETQVGEGTAMPEPTLDRTSRNYEFLFLFSKLPDYKFDRLKIDVPARKSYKKGDKANAGSVWETQDDVLQLWGQEEPGPMGVWRVNQEASRYPHVAIWPRVLVRQMLLPTADEGDLILDPFAGSGTTGEVAASMGMRAVLIESSKTAQAALLDRIKKVTEETLFP